MGRNTRGRSIGTSNGSNEAVTANNVFDFRGDYGNNTYDVRHSVNVTALWELPIGKDKALKVTGPANYVLGGWELGGVYNYRTGLPINVLITRADNVYQSLIDGKF